MAQNLKSNLSYFSAQRVTLSLLIIFLFFGFMQGNISTYSFALEDFENVDLEINTVPTAQITIPIDIIFSGYNEENIDLTMINNGLRKSIFYEGIDYVWNENTQSDDSLLDLEITLDFNFHFTTEIYTSELDSFIDKNSWNSNTSALNSTRLNLQEETGERMSIFYDQEGRAINGEAVEQYLVDHKGFSLVEPSYAIYFLNQSRYDSIDHSFEHWFEIDEVDPDSNVTADWWRLEWDNDLNPDVEYPYPCWGFQNRIFFVDPYCHQWYTRWTDIWWNADTYEGDFDYLTVDLDTYLNGYTPGTNDYSDKLNTYLTDYLNDIVSDVGGRGDGLLYDQKEVSAQILLINDEANHGYSQEDLKWIFHKETAEEAFEYVVPNEVATISLEETWVELSECSDIEQIINYYTLGETELGSYPWYRSDWRYLDGINIFYGFQGLTLASNYFNMTKGDTTFTSWILLLQNVSMVSWAYNEYREYTGLGGGGNVVCFKDLNRYFASDGTTPRSGLTTLLVHEIGHVLGFLHAEITNDADEGTGGFIRDVMSYYSEGTPNFSVFLKDSLYRTSSFVAYYRNKPAIDAYRENPDNDPILLAEIDEAIENGEAALETMNYLDAFLAFRGLYELTEDLRTGSQTQNGFLDLMLLLPIGIFNIWRKKRKNK